mmetsp:Transcript_77083/g.178798  ORF Transcript_77083/g.178798 Transcript_77083/m.178798 type:complete len:221 (-) Transcript_77083:1407-2069(-)
MAFSCTPTVSGFSFMARKTASIPPASAMGLIISSEQARLCSAKHAFSCSTADLGKWFMARTMAPMAGVFLTLILGSISKAKLPSAMMACSCTGSAKACASIAREITSTPSFALIAILLSFLIANCCSAQHPFSWTPAEAGCSHMAVRIAGMPLCKPIIFCSSSERKARFPMAPQALSCKRLADGKLRMASIIAGMPERLTIFFLLPGPKANSSRRAHPAS